MEQNETFEWPQGLKRTKPRQRVLEVLSSAAVPMTALDICEQIGREGESVWLSTVYRILDQFTERGIAVKTAVLDSGMALYELSRSGHRHYAVCMGCNKVIPMENCPMERFYPKLEESGFQVTGHKLEMYGYCKECVHARQGK